MSRYYTIYWRPDGWAQIGEGNPPTGAFGSDFWGRIQSGDRVYITNVMSGRLRLMSAFDVAKVMSASDNGYSASEELLAAEGSAAPVHARSLPDEVVDQLRFIGAGNQLGVVKRTGKGAVDGQTMRAVRELTEDSAQLLEQMLEQTPKEGWSENELRASVAAYFEMAAKQRAGDRVVKKHYYEDLAQRFGRSEGAFEYRMLNISYVLSQMGREWIKGLPPAKNVGVNIAAILERLIAEQEGKTPTTNASDSVKVAQARAKVKVMPTGSRSPKASTASISTYARDQAVKAWVLERAAGKCEACDSPAPFVDVNDFPFLEVHHVRHLADGGSDTPSNAVAVCPNCHRRLHYAKDAQDFRESLYRKHDVLKKE